MVILIVDLCLLIIYAGYTHVEGVIMSDEMVAAWQQWLDQWAYGSAGNDIVGGDTEEVTPLVTRRGRSTEITLQGTVLSIKLAYVAIWDASKQLWWIDPTNTGEGEIRCDLRRTRRPTDQMSVRGFISVVTNTSQITIYSKRHPHLLTKPPVRPK